MSWFIAPFAPLAKGAKGAKRAKGTKGAREAKRAKGAKGVRGVKGRMWRRGQRVYDYTKVYTATSGLFSGLKSKKKGFFHSPPQDTELRRYEISHFLAGYEPTLKGTRGYWTTRFSNHYSYPTQKKFTTRSSSNNLHIFAKALRTPDMTNEFYQKSCILCFFFSYVKHQA